MGFWVSQVGGLGPYQFANDPLSVGGVRPKTRSGQSEGRARGHGAKARATKKYEENQVSPPRKRKVFLVRDFMSSPVKFLSPADSIKSARTTMELSNIRHIPILEQEQIVGIVSDRDLLRAQSSPDQSPLAGLMTRHVLVAQGDVELRTVALVMNREKISCLPIIDQDKRLEGVITQSDLLTLLIQNFPLELWA